MFQQYTSLLFSKCNIWNTKKKKKNTRKSKEPRKKHYSIAGTVREKKKHYEQSKIIIQKEVERIVYDRWYFSLLAGCTLYISPIFCVWLNYGYIMLYVRLQKNKWFSGITFLIQKEFITKTCCLTYFHHSYITFIYAYWKNKENKMKPGCWKTLSIFFQIILYVPWIHSWCMLINKNEDRLYGKILIA